MNLPTEITLDSLRRIKKKFYYRSDKIDFLNIKSDAKYESRNFLFRLIILDNLVSFESSL